MEKTKILTAGVDIIGTRYHVCLLDQEGKHPRYYHGREDTQSGQNKLIAYLGPHYRVVIVESSLALILLFRLQEGRVTIKEEGEHYRVWQKAGIARGDAMARFAALLLYEQLIGPKPLTEKEERELLAAEWERALADVARIERAGQIIGEIHGGNESPKLSAEALRLLQASQGPSSSSGVEAPEYAIDSDDNSFLAKVARALAKDRTK
ncbi:MAG: hypothetical protein M0Q37_07785 [Sphaerochaeta sp.]|nr:hypothetical protein [Sphaerochaeta sp.]